MALTLCINLGRIDIFAMLSLPIHEHSYLSVIQVFIPPSVLCGIQRTSYACFTRVTPSVSFFNDCKWQCSFNLFCLFMAAPDLSCCSRASSRCSEQGLPSSCQARASHFSGPLVAEHGFQGTWAQQVQLQSTGSVVVTHRLLFFHNMQDLPRPGIKLASPALAGGFFTTQPPGKPWQHVFNFSVHTFHRSDMEI